MEETNEPSKPSTASLKQLSDMVDLALCDGILTNDETNLLCQMADSLNIDRIELESMLNERLQAVSTRNTSLSATKTHEVPLSTACLPALAELLSNKLAQVKESGLDQKVRDQLAIFATTIREKQEQAREQKEKEKQAFEIISAKVQTAMRQIADIENARKRRRSLLQNVKDSSIAEKEVEQMQAEDVTLASLRDDILAIPNSLSAKLGKVKLLKRIDELSNTTIFDGPKASKIEKASAVAGKAAGWATENKETISMTFTALTAAASLGKVILKALPKK